MSFTSEIDTVKNFLRSPGSIDIAELANTLGIINVSIEGPNGEQIKQTILNSIPLTEFFTLLGGYSDTVTSAACKILEKLLQSMNYADIMSSGLKEHLTLGLQFNSSEVRILALCQIEKCLETEEAVQDLVRSPIFPVILEGLGYEDTLISTKVTEFLIKLADHTSGLRAIFDSGSIAILNQLSQGNETVKFRVFDLVSRISISSPEAFQLCESSGTLSAMTSEFNSTDLLLKLNAIETFSKIYQSYAGYLFLERAGILQSLVDVMAQDDDSDIVLILVKCAALKFFGKLSEIEEMDFAEADNKYKILSKMDSYLSSSNMDIKITTINIIGVIGSNPRGLKLLSGSVTPNILGNFMDLYHHSVGDVKIACLQTISCLLGVSENQTPEFSDITHQIYLQIGGTPTPLSTLTSNTKQTLEDLRIASFAIMQKIALHPWGQTEMTNSKEFIDYILNRTTETTKLGKEWKFTIIQTLVKAPNAENIIPSNIFDRLTRYLREGPFYVRTEAAVAFETA
ncbi:26S proteasome non-ATPase regulatory subunit 5 [Glomus cerebriforme]|uniref:26S proteasome non-ATPase regulatory subunit 5 n=1 Tax=Glomus cerebriforme TaxID=658196 RepID=A0A397TK90_9GLOM|nr:26S proteasome non-ATPase regulatory subunit 5 [Glomus cerebriforme]